MDYILLYNNFVNVVLINSKHNLYSIAIGQVGKYPYCFTYYPTCICVILISEKW